MRFNMKPQVGHAAASVQQVAASVAAAASTLDGAAPHATAHNTHNPPRHTSTHTTAAPEAAFSKPPVLSPSEAAAQSDPFGAQNHEPNAYPGSNRRVRGKLKLGSP